MQVILFPLEVCVWNPSIFSLSLSEYGHSARSFNCNKNFVFVSSCGVNLYVGSGGRNANLAAIFEGQGGQQNKQHNSLKLKEKLMIQINFIGDRHVLSIISIFVSILGDKIDNTYVKPFIFPEYRTLIECL